MKTCEIDNCDQPAKGRKWCELHYTRWRRHGDPNKKVRPTLPRSLRNASDEERFWYWVDWSQPGCWNWKLALMPNGYGRFHIRGTEDSIYAHRVAYELIKGPIPAGYEIHHKCENKACVNPDHLEALTVAAHRGLGWGRTHCPHGHEYTEANTYVNPKGVKICRLCVYLSNRRSILRKRQAAKT